MQEISKSEAKHFIILFRDVGMMYRGLYTYNPDREEVFKIHGVGPRQLNDRMMEHFYKWEFF
jgi:calmodulin-regulated spectrin-associated protein